MARDTPTTTPAATPTTPAATPAPAPSPVAGATTGRGRGRSNRGGRGANRAPGTGGYKKAPLKKFEGRCEELKEHVYDFTNPKDTANSFTTTTEEIAEYVGRNYKQGNYIKRAIEQMTPATLAMPADLAQGASETAKEIWRQEISAYVKKKEILGTYMQNAYSLIYGQCSEGIQAKIESTPGQATVADKGDPIGLLKNIKTVMFQFQTTKYMPHAILDCKRRLYTMRQGKDMSVPDYFKVFKNNVDVVEHNGGSFGFEIGLINLILGEVQAGLDMGSATDAQKTTAQDKARDMSMGAAFILGADRSRYGKLIEDLENSYTQGDDKYPKNLTDAYKLLINWKQDPRNLMQVVQ